MFPAEGLGEEGRLHGGGRVDRMIGWNSHGWGGRIVKERIYRQRPGSMRKEKRLERREQGG